MQSSKGNSFAYVCMVEGTVQVLALHGDHDLLLAPYNVSLRIYEELGIEMIFPTLIKYI